jgi:hypothetical protein
LIVLVLGATVGLFAFRTTPGREPTVRDSTAIQNDLSRCLFIWGVASCGALFVFMMYYPGLCIRYLYDFWPGFAALVVVAWLPVSRRFIIPAGIALFGWLLFQCYRMDCRINPLPFPGWPEVGRVEFQRQNPRRLETSGFYDSTHLPMAAMVHFCDFQLGRANYVVQLAVDAPQFVHLVVGARTPESSGLPRPDTYRARIGVHELRLASVVPDSDPAWSHVTFEVPERIRRLSNDEFLFLCFVSTGDDEDRSSHRPIRSVQWR